MSDCDRPLCAEGQDKEHAEQIASYLESRANVAEKGGGLGRNHCPDPEHAAYCRALADRLRDDGNLLEDTDAGR